MPIIPQQVTSDSSFLHLKAPSIGITLSSRHGALERLTWAHCASPRKIVGRHRSKLSLLCSYCVDISADGPFRVNGHCSADTGRIKGGPTRCFSVVLRPPLLSEGYVSSFSLLTIRSDQYRCREPPSKVDGATAIDNARTVTHLGLLVARNEIIAASSTTRSPFCLDPPRRVSILLKPGSSLGRPGQTEGPVIYSGSVQIVGRATRTWLELRDDLAKEMRGK